MLKRQCSSDSAARRMPWWFFTIVSVIALTCVSCSDAVKLPSHSRQVTVQPPHITESARLPLTDSAPVQGDMTPTVSISPPTSMLVKPTPTPTPVVLQTTTIDDSIQGTDINQFNYVGNDWRHSLSECPGQNCYGTLPYNGSNSWDSTTDDYVTISFTGVQIKLYAVLDPAHGIGAISIDGGNENKVDFMRIHVMAISCCGPVLYCLLALILSSYVSLATRIPTVPAPQLSLIASISLARAYGWVPPHHFL